MTSKTRLVSADDTIPGAPIEDLEMSEPMSGTFEPIELGAKK